MSKIEKLLWNVRYITLLVVILSIISAFALIVLGSWNIIEAIIFYNPLSTILSRVIMIYFLKLYQQLTCS